MTVFYTYMKRTHARTHARTHTLYIKCMSPAIQAAATDVRVCQVFFLKSVIIKISSDCRTSSRKTPLENDDVLRLIKHLASLNNNSRREISQHGA